MYQPSTLPWNTEVVVDLRAGKSGPTYYYYLVSWANRAIMWYDELEMSFISDETSTCGKWKYCAPRVGK